MGLWSAMITCLTLRDSVPSSCLPSPSAGTTFMPWSPLDGFRKGLAADVPIIQGFTRNESVLFVYAFFKAPTSTLQWYIGWCRV